MGRTAVYRASLPVQGYLLLSHRVGHTESSKYVWIVIFSCLHCYSEVEWDERMYADWFS